jgi:siroheme decarboxylase
MDESDWAVLERLQQGIPLCSRPFAVMADDAGMSEEEFLRRVRALVQGGQIRRLGPRLRHHAVGVRGNIMVVWQVPGERVDEVGELLASSPAVTHCYVRPPFEGFPYNIYSMVHAADVTAAEAVIRELAARCGVTDYRMLHTVRELKKSTPIYRRPGRQQQ